MAVAASPALSTSTAGELLRAAAGGATEVLGALAGRPVMVVDLGTTGLSDPLPQWLPCVVVGLATSPAGTTAAGTPPATDGCDVVLAPGAPGALPAPWVAATDLAVAAGDLCRAITASPQASVLLAQVLRAAPARDVATGWWNESVAYSTLQGGPELAAWLAGRDSRSVQVGEDEPVLVDRRGPELWVTLNRPHVRNALDASLRDRLCTVLAGAAADPSVTAVHLQGTGPGFCSGGDLDEFGTTPDPVTGHLVRTTRAVARIVAGLGDRVTAHLHGGCLGAGIEIAAAARRVEATADTVLRLPEVAMGLIPGAGGTVTIPRRIGRHRTAWMGLSGQAVDAATAWSWGLVDEVVDGSARRVPSPPPTRATKRC